MELDTIEYINSDTDLPVPPPPPPPPPQPLKIRDTNGGPPPLVVLDGVITDIDAAAVDPEKILEMAVLKDKSATDKYGDKGKNGVIEITTKKKAAMSEPKEPVEAAEVTPVTAQKPAKEDLFVAVEETPQFSGGGRDAMRSWINQNLKYPGEAYNKKITGKVNVDFLVTAAGKVKDVKVIKPVNPLLDAEAIRVISSMPDWKPGTQHGKTVPVQMRVQVEFKLP
jgi:TonB family protein